MPNLLPISEQRVTNMVNTQASPALGARLGASRSLAARAPPPHGRPHALPSHPRRFTRSQESATIRCNFPETYAYLKAKKDRHPIEDAIEDFTQWTVLGEPVGGAPASTIPKPGHAAAAAASKAPKAPKEETEEEYVQRRCEEYMHKGLSSRRGAGGKFFTIGGGGDGGVSYQVIG